MIKVLYIHGTNGEGSSKANVLKKFFHENENIDVIEFKQTPLSPIQTLFELKEYIKEIFHYSHQIFISKKKIQLLI